MKRNKIFVAITGGIGSGKSTVAKIIADMGYPVYSADAVARNIYDEPEILTKIVATFPQCIAEGKVDRKKLAGIVFADANKLSELNAITHPSIMKKLFAMMESGTEKAAFAEVPLLFESGSEKDFDRVIIVMRDAQTRIAAVMQRDGLTVEEVVSRIKYQYNYERNPNTGHTVLYNNGDISSLKDSVVRIIHEILGDIRA